MNVGADEEILDFYRELFDMMDKDNLCLFYLYSENIEDVLQVVKKERSDNAGNEMWYPQKYCWKAWNRLRY